MSQVFTIQYRFLFCEDTELCFPLKINGQTLELEAAPPEAPPFWAAIDYHQCDNCPLDAVRTPCCPLCLALVPVVEGFGKNLSCDEVDVVVETAERKMSQNTTVQRALGSLMGLIMAVSGCPHMAFFKPMARFHLPMATEDETLYRAFSTYRLAQYYSRMTGGEGDEGLEGLKDVYARVHQVNMGIAKRIRDATTTDSSVNAVIVLDMFTKSAPYEIDDSMESFQHLFEEYLDCRATDSEKAAMGSV